MKRIALLFTVFVAFLATANGTLASALSDAAGALNPGQSVKLGTVLPRSLLDSEGADILQWSSSGVWDPVRKEVRFIGKRDSQYPYHFLVYSEATNQWSANRPLHPDLASSRYGHGYDHNTVDPVTGTHYFRGFGARDIYAWNGSWYVLRMPYENTEVAASVSWVTGLAKAGVPDSGIVFSDSGNVVHYNGTAWTSLGNSPLSEYHTVSEYNTISGVLIMGGGNGGSAMWKYDTKTKSISQIATPPFNVGASKSQGLLVSDPGSDQFIAWKKESTNWAQYDVSGNAWSSLSQSTGSGSSAQTGAPNLGTSESDAAVISIPIATYGVIMFVQYDDSGNAGVWLYKHSPFTAKPTPNAPTGLIVQ